MEEVQVLGDRIALLKNGRLTHCGSAAYFNKLFDIAPTLVFSFKDVD